MSVFAATAGWNYISTVEEKYFTVDISSKGTLSSIDSTTLFDVTDYDNIAQVAGSPLDGTSTHSSGVITTQRVDGSALTHGNQYSLEVVWTDSNSQEHLEVWPIICWRR